MGHHWAPRAPPGDAGSVPERSQTSPRPKAPAGAAHSDTSGGDPRVPGRSRRPDPTLLAATSAPARAGGEEEIKWPQKATGSPNRAASNREGVGGAPAAPAESPTRGAQGGQGLAPGPHARLRVRDQAPCPRIPAPHSPAAASQLPPPGARAAAAEVWQRAGSCGRGAGSYLSRRARAAAPGTAGAPGAAASLPAVPAAGPAPALRALRSASFPARGGAGSRGSRGSRPPRPRSFLRGARARALRSLPRPRC